MAEALEAVENWVSVLQAQADKLTNKLDTGTLNLKKSLATMGGMLTGMEAQQRRMMPADALEAEDLNPQNVDGAFLNPYKPIVYKLRKAFDRGELQLLVDEVGIDLDDLGGSGLLDICRNLVEHAARRKLLPLLLEKAGEHRPPAEDWTELLE